MVSKLWSILVAVFAEPKAFTLGGVAHFVQELLSLVGAAVVFRFTMKAPKVSAALVEPLGLFDVNKYLESFTDRGMVVRPELRAAIASLVAGDDPATFPNRQLLLNWDASVKGDVIRAPRIIRGGDPLNFPTTEVERVEFAKRMLDEPSQTSHALPNSPVELMALGFLRDDKTGIGWPHVGDNWPPSGETRRVPDLSARLIQCIEAATIDPLSKAVAFEQIHQARTFINWVEVRNESPHAVATGVRVTISHFSRGDATLLPLGTFRELEAQAEGFTGTARNILPRETRWAVIRSRQPIRKDQMTVFVDPTPFFHPGYFSIVAGCAGVLALLWMFVNALKT